MTKEEIRLLAESNLEAFIKLVHPGRVLGTCHKDVIKWWTRQDAKSHQILLFPRDHQKSALLAYRVAWEITKNPAIRILYVSATATLATKQLKFIKDILTSDIYMYYWPEMVNKDLSKREKWTETEISVDHPKRKQENIRDSTIFTAGLTTVITGLHADIACLDDTVIEDNAYSNEGRNKVATQASYLASIVGTEGRQYVVGTRYHPKDLYQSFQEMTIEIYDEEGNLKDSDFLYEVYEKPVETRGDGTGEYLWPRTMRSDGKWFGFSQAILAKKKSQYQDLNKFRAQYYNNPNDLSEAPIDPELFQYYDRARIHKEGDKVFFNGTKLNVFASIDFAYSLSNKADSTCVIVVGIDSRNNYYVLDIDRFKTNKISDYFDHILKAHIKWGFRKIRAEITAAQKVIVEDLKDNYIRPNGLALVVEDYRPTGSEGSKEERIEATLQPKYNNRQIWHYKGGMCELLEQELVMKKPPHDDMKDALASCIGICVPPASSHSSYSNKITKNNSNITGKFGWW